MRAASDDAARETAGGAAGRARTAGRRVPAPLLGAAIGLGAIALLLAAGLLVGGAPSGVDRSIVLGLRMWGGPRWLRFAAIDVTALGGVTVLTLWVVAAAVVLAAQRRWAAALAVAASGASVSLAINLVKRAVARPRPAIVPHLVEVNNASFPSGHAAGSAAIYLTLAALAARAAPAAAARRATMALAVALVALIGASRVYLGVHWPSDVLAGWGFGAAWALAWWVATERAR